uniref:Uncharacterized protein n=1 Tax=Glossina austeni TaxID=7395 RepID=A0A1A9VEX2_GLOAU
MTLPTSNSDDDNDYDDDDDDHDDEGEGEDENEDSNIADAVLQISYLLIVSSSCVICTIKLITKLRISVQFERDIKTYHQIKAYGTINGLCAIQAIQASHTHMRICAEVRCMWCDGSGDDKVAVLCNAPAVTDVADDRNG